MSNRIKKLFATQKAYVGYLTVGDGGLRRSVDIAQAMIAGGVNMLELGVPFSDPVADGPVIQRAAQRAVANNTTLADVLQVAATLRQSTDIPLILFSYYNPLLIADAWLAQAAAVGIDGVLVVDLPYEEGGEFYAKCSAHGIAPISIITPATSTKRLKMITRHAQGFLYYACRAGTTGVQSSLPAGLAEQLATVKQHSKLPVVVGFGVSDATMVRNILQHADGFVVGSYFMKALEEGASPTQLTQLTRSLCC